MKPICHTLISIALIFYADMNVPGDDHQGTKVELARDGEEVHCWQTSLEEVEAPVFGFCISVFGHKLQYIMSEEWCIWIKEFVTYIWIKDENPFQHIETLIFVQNPPVCREEKGLSRAGKSGKNRQVLKK